MTKAGPFDIIGRPRSSLAVPSDDGETFVLKQELWPVEYGGLEEPAAVTGGGADSCIAPPRGTAGAPVAQAIGYNTGGGRLSLVIPESVEEGDVLFIQIGSPNDITGGVNPHPLYWHGWHPLYFSYSTRSFTHAIYYRIAEAMDAGKTLLPATEFDYMWFVATLRAYVCGGPGTLVTPHEDRTHAWAADYAASKQVSFFLAADPYQNFGLKFHHNEGKYPLVVGPVDLQGVVVQNPIDRGRPIGAPGPRTVVASEHFDHDEIQLLKLQTVADVPSPEDPDSGRVILPYCNASPDPPPAGGSGEFGEIGVTGADTTIRTFATDSCDVVLLPGTSSPPVPQAFTLVHSASPGSLGDWTIPTDEGSLTMSGGLLTTSDPEEVTTFSVNNDNAAPYGFRGDKYAAIWHAPGEVGDHHKVRMHFKQPVAGGGFIPMGNWVVVANMVDRAKGLAFWLGNDGVGWTKNLKLIGSVEALVTGSRPTTLYGQDPGALNATRDIWSTSFGIPGYAFYPADYPLASPPPDPNFPLDIAYEPVEFWLELWRHGVTYTAYIYRNDPDVYPPVYESHYTVASDDALYGPSVTGYFGWAAEYMSSQLQGLVDIALFVES